jgi:hypothetical protein
MEKFVPTKLIVSAFTLREEGNTGKFTKEKDIVKDKPILNKVETDITKYEVGEGSKKEVLVLTKSPASELASASGATIEEINEIIKITIKGNLKQFRSITNAINTSTSLTVDKTDLLLAVKSLEKLHDSKTLKINEQD